MSRPVWLTQRERGAQWAVRLILWIALRLGRAPARLLLLPITGYFLLFAPQARQASRLYLNRHLCRPARWLDVARHIHCFAATILDRVYFLSGQFHRFSIRVHGQECVEQLMAAGKGGLLLSAHLGSFDALRALGVSRGGLPLRILMYPEHNSFITGLFSALNPRLAQSIIPLGGVDSLLKVHESIQRGELVGMLGDRVAESDKLVPCRFLDGEVMLPAGPALLAATLKVPVVLVFGLYQGGNRYDIYFESLAEPLILSRSGRAAALQQWMQSYAERLEYYVRLSPDNWFNFYDFWNDARSRS